MAPTPPDRSLRQRFHAEVSQVDDEINLARAALLVAREEYPHQALHVQHLLSVWGNKCDRGHFLIIVCIKQLEKVFA